VKDATAMLLTGASIAMLRFVTSGLTLSDAPFVKP
jgi:hypothetical protein